MRIIAVVIIAFIIGLAAGLGGGYIAFSPKQGGAVKKLPEEIPIGGLFGLTGDLSEFSKRHQAAAQMAIEDVNAYVKALGYNVKFVLIPEDTQGTQEGALAKIQALAAKGVKVVVGPLSSAEVKAVKSFADSEGIVVISHSSTSPALAIPGDYIFRFVPTDEFQGRALARLL
ncbi:MAG: ABC transporter substrate-binding protein, partial [Thermoprotei archaeon]